MDECWTSVEVGNTSKFTGVQECALVGAFKSTAAVKCAWSSTVHTAVQFEYSYPTKVVSDWN